MSKSYQPDQELARLYAALQAIKDPAMLSQFLAGVLTTVELRDLGLRWALLERLLDGQSQRSIARDLGISLCKITRGAKILKAPSGPVQAALLEQQAGRERWQAPLEDDLPTHKE